MCVFACNNVFMYMYIYNMYAYVYITCMSVCPHGLSVCLSVRRSVGLRSVCRSVGLSAFRSVGRSVCRSVCLSVFLSVCVCECAISLPKCVACTSYSNQSPATSQWRQRVRYSHPSSPHQSPRSSGHRRPRRSTGSACKRKLQTTKS